MSLPDKPDSGATRIRSPAEVRAALEHNRAMEHAFEEMNGKKDPSLHQFKGRVDALAWVLGHEQPTMDRARSSPLPPADQEVTR